MSSLTKLPICDLVKIICTDCLVRLTESIMKRDAPKLCGDCEVKVEEREVDE